MTCMHHEMQTPFLRILSHQFVMRVAPPLPCGHAGRNTKVRVRVPGMGNKVGVIQMAQLSCYIGASIH